MKYNICTSEKYLESLEHYIEIDMIDGLTCQADRCGAAGLSSILAILSCVTYSVRHEMFVKDLRELTCLNRLGRPQPHSFRDNENSDNDKQCLFSTLSSQIFSCLWGQCVWCTNEVRTQHNRDEPFVTDQTNGFTERTYLRLWCKISLYNVHKTWECVNHRLILILLMKSSVLFEVWHRTGLQ
jgi:hypothetical protein